MGEHRPIDHEILFAVPIEVSNRRVIGPPYIEHSGRIKFRRRVIIRLVPEAGSRKDQSPLLDAVVFILESGRLRPETIRTRVCDDLRRLRERLDWGKAQQYQCDE
jgi:hypothetical protein